MEKKIVWKSMVCKRLQYFAFFSLPWNIGKVGDRFCVMVRFKYGLRIRGRVNREILDVIIEISHRCKYMQVFLKYKYHSNILLQSIVEENSY